MFSDDGRSDSDESDGAMSDSGSEDQNNPRHRAKQVLDGLRSGQKALEFRGQAVACPLCTARDPRPSLYHLWQHCKDLGRNGNDKKMPSEHRHLATFITSTMLGMPADRAVVPRHVQDYCDAWQRQPEVTPALLPPPATQAGVPGEHSGPLAAKRPAQGEAAGSCGGYKRVFVPMLPEVTEDTLEIVWPPSVLLWVRRDNKQNLTVRQAERWIRSVGRFELLDKATFREGSPSSVLVVFEPSMEGFLEAVQLDLLLNNRAKGQDQPRTVDGLALGGRITCVEIPGRFKSIKKLELVGFRQRVLASFQSQKAMLAVTQTDATAARAELWTRQQDMEDTTQQMMQLTEEANRLKDKFQQQAQLYEDERAHTDVLRRRAKEAMEEKEREKQQTISDIRNQYEHNLSIMIRTADQEKQSLVEQIGRLQLEQNVQQLEVERVREEQLQKLETKHQQEKLQLLKAQDEERRKAKEEAELQIAKYKELSRAEYKTWNRTHKMQERQKVREEVDFKAKMETMLNSVSKVLEEEHRQKQLQLRRKYQLRLGKKVEELEEAKEDAEDKHNMVNVLTSMQRALNDKVTQMNKVLEASWRRATEEHWAFCRHPKLKDTSVYMKAIGDLSGDEELTDALWKYVLRRHSLPSGLLRGLTSLPPGSNKYVDAYNLAQDEYVEVLTSLQKNYVENSDFEPWRVSAGVDDHNRKYVLTEDGMEELLETYGRRIGEAVRRVAKELDEFNSSGRYKEYVLWHAKHKRPATPAEVVRAMDLRGKEILKCMTDLQLSLEKTSRTRAGRASSNYG